MVNLALLQILQQERLDAKHLCYNTFSLIVLNILKQGSDLEKNERRRRKNCIRQTLTLSKCADSSTNTILFFLQGVEKKTNNKRAVHLNLFTN